MKNSSRIFNGCRVEGSFGPIVAPTKKVPFGTPTFPPIVLHFLHDIRQKGSLLADVFLRIIAFLWYS